MRIGISTYIVRGALGVALISLSAAAAEDAPATPADGVSTNRIMFKKPIRRTYGKPLEVVRSDVKINPHPKAESGAPTDALLSPVAAMNAGQPIAGAANYYNEMRAAQARQQQGAKDKQDSLWTLPEKSLTELGSGAELPSLDRMSEDNTKTWGWMADGMQRLDGQNPDDASAPKKDSDQDVVDGVLESLALDRAQQAEADGSRAGKKEGSAGSPNEFRAYGDSRTAARKDSDISRPWASADRPSDPNEEKDEDTPAPWLAQSTDAKSREDKDDKEDKPQGWGEYGNQGLSTARTSEASASGSLISGGAWTNAGWGGASSPYADPRLAGNMNTPWAPSSTPTNSLVSGSGMPSSPWTASPPIGGPAPMQSGFQPIFVQPGTVQPGKPITVDRPVRRNYLDPTAPRN